MPPKRRRRVSSLPDTECSLSSGVGVSGGRARAPGMEIVDLTTSGSTKRKALQRSPPSSWEIGALSTQCPNVSVIDYLWDQEQERSKKKQKADEYKESISGESGSSQASGTQTRLVAFMKRADKEVRNLANTVKGNRNTKVEIKQQVEKLRSTLSLFMTDEMQEVRPAAQGDLGTGGTEQDRGDLTPAAGAIATKTFRDMGTQTQPMESVRFSSRRGDGVRDREEREETQRRIGETRSRVEMLVVVNRWWDEAWFSCTSLEEGNPLGGLGDTDTAVKLVGTEGQLATGLGELYRERFPQMVSIRNAEAGAY